MVDRCVFTVARGDRYLKFAFTLARSFKYHNGTEIPFFIISDQSVSLPKDLAWVKLKKVDTELITPGVEFKLNFPEIIPADKAIFLDADSVVYRNISPIFDIENSSVAVIGQKVYIDKWKTGIWGKAHEDWLEEFSIPYMIHFPGAFYYLHAGNELNNVFKTAKELRTSRSDFQRHRQSFNEEPILSVSLAKHGINPIENLGNIYSDISQLENHKNLNVLTGRALFRNTGETHFKDYMPYGNYEPIAVHTGSLLNKNPWLFEAVRLKLHYKLGLPAAIADLIVTDFLIKPYFLLKKIRKSFLN